MSPAAANSEASRCMEDCFLRNSVHILQINAIPILLSILLGGHFASFSAADVSASSKKIESEKDAAQRAMDLAWSAKSGCDFPLLGGSDP